MSNYVVTGAYVTLKVFNETAGAWELRGFHAGTPVPDNVDAASLQHHIDSQLVAPADSDAALAAGPAGLRHLAPGPEPRLATGQTVSEASPIPFVNDPRIGQLASEADEPPSVEGESPFATGEPPQPKTPEPADYTANDPVPQEVVQAAPEQRQEAVAPEQPAESQVGQIAPSRSASKAQWVEYAVAQGADPDEAQSLTKDDLVEQYG